MKTRMLILIGILVLVTPFLFAAYGPKGGIPQQSTGGESPLSLTFMAITMIIPIVIVCRRLAKEKGRNVTRYTVLGIIPVVNLFALWYMIGASNKYSEEKIDRILSYIEKQQGQKKK